MGSDVLPVMTQTPVPQLLGNVIEKEVARKFDLCISLEHQVRLEAPIHTGANITMMSNQLFKEVQESTKRTSRTLQLQRCTLTIQEYSKTGL